MTEVVFHYGVADKLDYACRLLRKVARSGLRARVVMEPGQAAALSARLWALSSTAFVAHCDSSASASVRRRSPVLIADADTPHNDDAAVLLNLRDAMPQEPQRYQRVLEIISTDMADRQNGRARKRQYDASDCTVILHDAAAASGAMGVA